MITSAQDRKSNLELLRIIGILMIVMMHFCSQGGIPTGDNLLTTFFASGGRMAVNIFLIIGCWFMVDSPFRPERVVKLYLQVVFYSIPITLLMLGLGEAGGFRNLAQGLVPFFGRSVWFASAYISLIILSPFLNRIFLLPLPSLRRLVAILFVFFVIVSTIPNFSPLDYVADFTWFCVVYIFMGWAKRDRLFERLGGKWRCLAIAVVTYGTLCSLIRWTALGGLSTYWADNIKSAPSFVFGLFTFAFFLKLDIGSRKWINLAARSVFTVYIIHQIPAFMHFEWHTVFRSDWLASQSAAVRALGIPAVALAVFAAASIIDLIRIKLEPLYLESRPVKWVTRKLFSNESPS